jgi:hypothetical protein
MHCVITGLFAYYYFNIRVQNVDKPFKSNFNQTCTTLRANSSCKMRMPSTTKMGKFELLVSRQIIGLIKSTGRFGL